MRRIFADTTRSWNQQWKQILWSDESRFCLHQHDGRIKIYRQPKTWFYLSLIEHVWDQLEQSLRKTEPLPRNTTELKDVLNYLWLTYPQSSIRKLIDSMPRRIIQCIRKRGGATSY